MWLMVRSTQPYIRLTGRCLGDDEEIAPRFAVHPGSLRISSSETPGRNMQTRILSELLIRRFGVRVPGAHQLAPLLEACQELATVDMSPAGSRTATRLNAVIG
jgi:hypothetical protein